MELFLFQCCYSITMATSLDCVSCVAVVLRGLSSPLRLLSSFFSLFRLKKQLLTQANEDGVCRLLLACCSAHADLTLHACEQARAAPPMYWRHTQHSSLPVTAEAASFSSRILFINIFSFVWLSPNTKWKYSWSAGLQEKCPNNITASLFKISGKTHKACTELSLVANFLWNL